MARFIVMDIVFYANSLNYDQGSGNYQELKKITKWDGRQYTFVSRYALRYSLLETGRKLSLWDLAGGTELKPEGKGEQKVIQPAENLLYSGEILKYPEFDLFGYLITSTNPQNFREAPVKISHAISLTPFQYDALFNANIGLANRLRKTKGDMKPNPFTAEEHVTYYLYSIIIDVDRIGKVESYFQLEDKRNLTAKIEGDWLILLNSNDEKKFRFKLKNDDYELINLILPLEKTDLAFSNINDEVLRKLKFNPEAEVLIVEYAYKKVKERIKKLVKAILNLRRQIKGRDENLSPKLLVLGLYKNAPYKTLKDKILLIDEYTEEEYDEIIEKEEKGKMVRKVIHRVSKFKKPLFKIEDIDETQLKLLPDEKSLWAEIENKLFGNEEKKEIKRITVYYTPEITIEFSKKQ